jgi:hypothetical protein
MAQHIVQYLEGRVRQSVITDVVRVANYQSKTPSGSRGGFFSIPRIVFCYVDFLGSVAFQAAGTTSGGEQFIKIFFPANYHAFAELMYCIFRHGTVHELVPKALFADFTGTRPQRIKIRWIINNENTAGHRSANMKFYRMAGKRATLHLALNLCQLADDLATSLNSFIVKLKWDSSYRRACQRRLDGLLAIKDANFANSIQGSSRRSTIIGQIQLAWNTRAGRINDKGETLPGT